MAQAEATTSKFGAVAKVALGIAAVAAVKFVSDSVEAYNEHQQALLQLQTTISNSPKLVGASTKAFEDQATALQNLTGFQDEEVLKADAVLGRFGLTADQLKEINPLILDYARATGQDAATAAGALGKALLGNTRALKAIGISFTATGNTAQDFNAIVDLMKGKVGGLAEAYGKTLPGQLAIASAKFDDIKETVGKAVVPILNKLLDVAQPLLGVFQLAANHTDLVVAALLGFAAVKFVPVLITAIGTAAQAAAAQMAALEVSSIGGATALGTIAKIAPLAGLGLGGYKENAFEGNKVINAFAEGNLRADGTIRKVGMTAEEAAAKQSDLAAKTNAVTQAMKDQRTAAHELVGGLLGLTASAKDLADKQALVNRLQDEGKDHGKKYNDAVLDLLTSQDSFNQQLRDYITKQKEAGLSTEDAVGKVVHLGKTLGLTKEDVLRILGPLDQYKSKLDAIPSTVNTTVTTTFRQQGDFPNRGTRAGPTGIQHGGTVTRTGLAIVHKGEVFSGTKNEMGFGGINGDIVLNIDGKTFARITRDELQKLGSRNVTAGIP